MFSESTFSKAPFHPKKNDLAAAKQAERLRRAARIAKKRNNKRTK